MPKDLSNCKYIHKHIYDEKIKIELLKFLYHREKNVTERHRIIYINEHTMQE